MSVVGFDIGNENCVIAVAKQGGIDVILNEESKRETPAVVSFGEKQRFIGSAGLASATMNPKSTISQIKRLIGRRFQDPEFQEEMRTLPFSIVEGPDGGVLPQINYLGEMKEFSPVQILGMLFAHLKEIAQKSLEIPVTDCVIGIPSYFSDLERRAYLNAASIAGLKPLRLMHDCTATALSYGIYKTDFASSGPTHVVFVDIGHLDTQVTVTSFEAGQLKVVAHAFDRNLGGRNFDEILFNYFAQQFKEEYKIDVHSNIRASVRLRAACEKLKKVLSANAEAPLAIECLMDEKDVKGFIKRDEFEKLSADFLEMLKAPCQRALSDAGLSHDKIHSVELVGSGSRIPAVAKTLATLFKREPSRTLNASECVARGCALQCAMLSPVFRVRDYEVQDCFPFAMGLLYDGNMSHAKMDKILFPRGQPIPSVKVLTFYRNSTFTLEAFYGDSSDLRPGMSQKISSFVIGPFQASSREKARVKVRVRLNLHGIVTVESASLIEDELASTAPRGIDVSMTDSMQPEFTNVPSNSLNGVEDGIASGSTPASPSDVMRKGSKRIELSVIEMAFGGMSKAELTEAQEKELQLSHQDQLMEQTKDKKNALEAFVYEMRNKLFDKYRNYATDPEREQISRNLQQTEEWLYDEGDDESMTVYINKLDELKKIVDPIENRFKDEEARVQATRELLNCIVDYRMAVKSMVTTQRDAVITECNKAEQWLREKSQQQDALPKNVDPVLWSTDIKQRVEGLDMYCRQILRPKASPSKQDDKGTSFRTRTDDGTTPMETDHAHTR